MGKVVKRARDSNGNLIGKTHLNPLLNTALYEVEFADGTSEAYAANVIAESLYAQEEAEGGLPDLEVILDHESDETAVAKKDGWNQADK
jgi:hypothetical protein